MHSQKFQSTKCIRNFTRLRFSILRAWTLCCGFRGIPENSEPTLICGLCRIFSEVHRPHCATPPPTLQHIATHTTYCNTLHRTSSTVKDRRRVKNVARVEEQSTCKHHYIVPVPQTRNFFFESNTQKHHSEQFCVKAPLRSATQKRRSKCANTNQKHQS